MMNRIKVFLSLCLALLGARFKRKPLWLISDRSDGAGDNGEALFRYLRAEHPEIDARFTVSAKASEYRDLRRLGHVVPWRSLRRKVLTLLADCLVSSQAERTFTNPFWGYDRLVRRRLASKPFVFLQHGVTKDDISAFVRSRAHPISAIVCASARERDAFLAPSYGFRPDQVWLTGFPRYDRLTHAERKYVLVMPTWRRYFADDPDAARTFERTYREFLTHPGLLRTCRATGYRIVFAPHPNARRYVRMCEDGDVVTTASPDTPCRTLISEAAMLVTDYSSVAFDFAYLDKPVVYFQYDQAQFWNGAHTYGKGYFDYERDGFGPVVTTVKALVDVITQRLSSHTRNDDVFLSRGRSFFAYPADHGNAKRVYERIANAASSCPWGSGAWRS